jgi:hypothetical protein
MKNTKFNLWNLKVSNSLKEAACQCAYVDTILVSFDQKMSTKSSKIACRSKNYILKGGRSAIASCALIFWNKALSLHSLEAP